MIENIISKFDKKIFWGVQTQKITWMYSKLQQDLLRLMQGCLTTFRTLRIYSIPFYT